MAIKYVAAIWDESETVYVTAGGFTPFLDQAVLFDDYKGPLHPIMNWLPVFIVDDLMDDDDMPK